MADEGRADGSRAALVFSFFLLMSGLVAGVERVPPPECKNPYERESSGPHTHAVGCDSPNGTPAIRGPARRLFGLPIDPNRADAATLETLPGIGEGRAAAIIAGRAEGTYRRAADLTRIHGIGPKTVAALAPWLHFPDRPANSSQRVSMPQRETVPEGGSS